MIRRTNSTLRAVPQPSCRMDGGDAWPPPPGAKAITVCGEFKRTGDAYFAAKSRLVEMKS